MRNWVALPLVAIGLAAAGQASAQSALEPRVDRLEKEMRAVQRKVFPGGAIAQIEPQITAPEQQSVLPGSPAGSPLANLESRVSALESQQSTLTGQIEQAQYQMRQLQQSFDTYKRATETRLKALEGTAAAAAPLLEGEGAVEPPPTQPTRGPGNGGGTLGNPSRPSASAPAASAPAVAGVERPAASGDAAEDAYIYGYRLWSAKQFPAAIAALKPVVEKYPKHRRASFAQNLIGRSYLDDGKPSLASIAFYDNYKKMPDGERAPDSLYYLAQALVELKKPKDACEVYGELTDVYGDRISASMKSDVARGRTAAKCA